MKRNKSRIQRGAKKILSVALAASMLNGTMTYTTYSADLFSDQSIVESDEFTDKVGEDNSSMNTEEIPEAVNAFNDGEGLNAMGESSAGTKNEITLEGNTVNVKNRMFNVKNNHDGSLTIDDGELKVDGTFEIKDSSKMDYCVAYRYYFYDGGANAYSSWKNSEYRSPYYDPSEWIKYSSSKISLTNSCMDHNNVEWKYYQLLYTLISVGRYDNNKFSLATVQEVRNPVKVNYDSQGGTVEKTTDWLWDTEEDRNRWGNNVPTKKGSQFLGWYTSPETDGEKIESVAEVVSVSDGQRSNEITLYAHWKEHKHSWEYAIDENHKNILKAYCSESNIKCDYYGTSAESAQTPITLTLQLKNLDENGCISYSGSAYNGAEIVGKDDFVSLTGKTVTGLTYAKKGDTNYMNVAPTNPGIYTVKVAVGDSSNLNQYELTADFEITKAPINPQISLDDIIYMQQADLNIQVIGNTGNGGIKKYQYKSQESSDETYTEIKEADLKTLPVGRYSLKATIGDTDNYKGGIAKCNFEVKKATPEIILSKATPTYTGKAANYSFSQINLAGNEQYNKDTHGEIKYSYRIFDSSTDFTDGLPVAAGTYEVKATLAASANYNETSATAKLIIKPKDVTVKPDAVSKHINMADPQLTYKAENLIDGESLKGITLKRDAGEDARDYEIMAIQDTGANPNYNVTLEKGVFTIQDHDWSGAAKVLVSPTRWSEGKQEKTCAFDGCNEKRYDTIPRTGETETDPYADRIDKYAMVLSGNIKGATLNNKETQLLNATGIFGAEEKDKITNGRQKAKIWIKITEAENIIGTNQYDLIKKEAEKISGTNAVLPAIINIELFRQLTGENKVSITNPGIEMNIRLEIPDEMLNKQPYTIRNYKVIRLHTDPTTNVDAVDTLDASFNANSNEITFETDRFSVYALTYKDTYYSPSYPVTGIKVSPESITLTKKDETAQLTAEVTPSYADNKKVTWKSSDEKVAIVDENGKVTAVGNGTATITATSVSGSYTATVSVTVKIPVEIEKLTIEAEKETLTQTGETTELKVKIEPENADEQKLIWKSDNEMVAAVDENGKVTAVGNGTATITVTTEDGKVTASVTITVKVPEKPVINKTTGFGRLRARSAKQTETSVTLQWNRLNDVDGYLIYGNRCNGNGKTYKYKKLATITNGKTQTWVQKGLKKGTFYKYIVKAYKLVDGKKVVTDISISVHTVTRGGAYGIAKSVSVTKIGNKKNTLGVTLKKGQKSQITAKEVKKDNKIKHHRNLCYESSNTKVATVTSKGLIQAKGKGTCKIWVYAQNGVYKELTITVK